MNDETDTFEEWVPIPEPHAISDETIADLIKMQITQFQFIVPNPPEVNWDLIPPRYVSLNQ